VGLGLRTVFHLSLIVKNCLNCLTLCKKKVLESPGKALEFLSYQLMGSLDDIHLSIHKKFDRFRSNSVCG